jgi:branched-chain amino acid transport system ATP-binding protein
MMLSVQRLSRTFRGLVALNEVSFDVDSREIVALIGPNGAGKTTCFNLIAGALRPTTGDVYLQGERINGRRPEEVAQRGLIRTFQIVRPLSGMTVLENVMVGALLRTSSVYQAAEVAKRALVSVALSEKEDLLASGLTLPDRKMLELARAIAARPKLLLLDEIMAGLRAGESDRIVQVVRDLRAAGMTILLIEHVMRVVMALADRVIVLHHGEKIAEGSPTEIGGNQAVIDSYLGRKARLQ